MAYPSFLFLFFLFLMPNGGFDNDFKTFFCKVNNIFIISKIISMIFILLLLLLQ